jgi:carbamoyltransferase
VTQKTSYVLGLGGSNHDFSAVLAADWDIRIGIEQERLTRRKHGSAFWFQHPVQESINYCLESTGIRLEDVDEIVGSDLLPARARTMTDGRGVRLFEHHLCHAASVAMMVPSGRSAAILVADGMGAITKPGLNKVPYNFRETISFFEFIDGKLVKLGGTEGRSLFEHDDYPSGCTNSIGKFYEVVTHTIGFAEMEEGKTMGLAGFGEPRFVPLIKDFYKLGDSLDNCFECDPVETGLGEALEGLLRLERNSFNCRADIAASAQFVFEEVLLHAQRLLLTESRDMFLFSGGCALNTVCNARLSGALGGQTRFLAPPHAGDAGVGMGAAWLAQRERLGQTQNVTVCGNDAATHIARLGRRYTDHDINRAVNSVYPQLALDEGHSTPEGIAKLLAEGKVLGFFEGRSEFGPRALGGRSLLSDPGTSQARERINREIKHREPFRPLAPIIPEELFDTYFEPADAADRFMMRVANAKPETRRLAPAAVHVDNTSRVQIVTRIASPILYDVLMAFLTLTGCPILINTSFNARGEPIVETPADAIAAFFSLGLDALAFDGKVYFTP